MKKISLLVTMVMCFMSVSLFATETLTDDDSKVVKVFTQGEIDQIDVFNTVLVEISSVIAYEVDGELVLEVSGLDNDGELVKLTKKEGVEILPCGSCVLKINGQPTEAMIVIFNHMEACITCEVESAPGPL